MKHFVYGIGSILLCAFLCGCSVDIEHMDRGDKKVTYQYEEAQVTNEFKISKSIYSDDELDIYISDLGDGFELTCFDKDFQMIDKDFDAKYKNGKYCIKGENADLISGIELRSQSVIFHIRYLDSNQYAVLCEYDATDAGWIIEGDAEKYYTEEELNEQKRSKEEYINRQSKNFSLLEGYWYCKEDSDSYLHFYIDEDGSRKLDWNYLDSNGEYVLNKICVDQIDFVDAFDGKEVHILDGISWGSLYVFDISEDMNTISQNHGDKIEYIRDTE